MLREPFFRRKKGVGREQSRTATEESRLCLGKLQLGNLFGTRSRARFFTALRFVQNDKGPVRERLRIFLPLIFLPKRTISKETKHANHLYN